MTETTYSPHLNWGKYTRRFFQYFVLLIIVVIVFVPIVILVFGALKRAVSFYHILMPYLSHRVGKILPKF